MSESHSVVSTLCDPTDYTVHGILQAYSGVGSLSLFQGIFPTQGSNPVLPHCGQIFLPAEPPGKPEGEQLTKLKHKQTNKKKPHQLVL